MISERFDCMANGFCLFFFILLLSSSPSTSSLALLVFLLFFHRSRSTRICFYHSGLNVIGIDYFVYRMTLHFKWSGVFFFHRCTLNFYEQDLFHAVVIVRDKFHICNCSKNNMEVFFTTELDKWIKSFHAHNNAYIHARRGNATKCTICFSAKSRRRIVAQ